MSSPADRRRYPRVPFRIHARLLLGASEHQGTMVDISAKGGLFVADEDVKLSISQICALEILHVGERPVLVVDGSIVHFAGREIGIDFVHGDDDAARRMAQVIEREFGTPPLIA